MVKGAEMSNASESHPSNLELQYVPQQQQRTAISTKSPGPEEPLNKWVLLMIFVSAIGGFLFGYDTGVVSGAMIIVRKEFHLTTLWQELIITVTIMAAWLSSLVAGTAADIFGRKKVVMMSSLVFTVGALVMGFAPDKETLLIGRIIVGVAIGFASMCVPVYLSEIAPVHIRGRVTVIFTLLVTGGQLVASIICGLFSGSPHGWRWMFGLGCVPSIIQFVAFIFVPESPRWLCLKGRYEEATTILETMWSNKENIRNEIESYKDNEQNEQSSLLNLLQSPTVRRALILGCLLQFYQQLSGINTVMYYSASIIAMAGVEGDQTVIWLTVLTSFCNFAFTFVGLYLVERVGRRPLTLGSLVGVVVALLGLAVSFQIVYINSPPITGEESNSTTICSKFAYCNTCTRDSECGYCFYKDDTPDSDSFCLLANHSSYNALSDDGDCSDPDNRDVTFSFDWCPSDYAWFSILGLSLYLCFFAPGMGPMPWTINSEIYPNWARAKATSVTTSVNWASNILVSLTFLTLTEAITKQGTFYLYSGMAFSALVVFFFILPETKGVPLEEVENLFKVPLCSIRPWKKETDESHRLVTDNRVSYQSRQTPRNVNNKNL